MKNSILVLVTILLTNLSDAQEQKSNLIPQISVFGEGKVIVVPDQACITVGVQNTGKEAAEVKKLNDETISKVIKFLKKSGIATTDFKTSNVSLNKSYDYEKKKSNFEANQTLSITLKDLSKYDEIMMGLNETGINLIQGVEFKSSKLAEYEKEARKNAMLNAKQKANDFVSVLGQKVGKALMITDNSVTVYPQPMYKSGMMDMASEMVGGNKQTLASGEITINANVNVSFVLE
jgi:uncharacterized protein YggE